VYRDSAHLCWSWCRDRTPRGGAWAYGGGDDPPYEGDVDLERVLRALRRAGYDHDANIEDESLGHFAGEERKQVLKRDVSFVKEIIGRF